MSDVPPARAVESRWSSSRWDIRGARLFFFLGTVMVAQATVRPAFGLTLSQILFLIALALCAFAGLRGHPIAPLSLPLLLAVCLFAVGGAISSLSARSPSGSAIEVFQGIFVMLLWGWTASMVLRTRRHFLVTLTLWGVSAAIAGVGAMGQELGLAPVAAAVAGDRASGFTDHPNDLGGAAAVALIPCLLLATTSVLRPGLIARMLLSAVAVLVALGLLLSGSVAGLAAAAVGTVIWLSAPWIGGSARIAVVAAVASGLVAMQTFGGTIASPTERVERVTSAPGTGPGTGSGQNRLAMLQTLWPRITERENPIVGVGLDADGKAVRIISAGQNRAYQIHGAPLAAWYEAGLFGVVGVLAVWLVLLALGWRTLATAGDLADLLIGWALFAAFAAFLVYAMSSPFVFQQYGWFAGVIVVAWRFRDDHLRRPTDRRLDGRSNRIGIGRFATEFPVFRA